ncbi:hypothetical protein SSX86_011285 [Deinandra increscens subsp. villosa]|uniref:Uncharacterized protein n=1 Tax=Deinandra increscens subsp. villosa TaxID=3103831 RepID=A0AAP0DAT0_9ASTR
MVNDREAIFDIESNQSECQEDLRNEQVTGSERVKNVLRSLGLTLSFTGLEDDQIRCHSNSNSMKTGNAAYNNDVESLENDEFEGKKRENMPLMGKTKEKQKVKNSKKGRAAKPPRPHRGPSLNTSDLRLVKEISELVMKKRARIERMKSLKKLRSVRGPLSSSAGAAASSTSKISFFAMIVTVFFLTVIIFQGFGSRTTGIFAGQFDSKLPK